MEESQRVCGHCGHVKRGHALPRAEGGHGGGDSDSGHCVVYGCHCPTFESTDAFEEQEYVGDAMPKWVADGVKVKVKRGRSVSVSGNSAHGNYAGGGEVGTIYRVDGIGWWSWDLQFAYGRHTTLGESTLEDLARVR